MPVEVFNNLENMALGDKAIMVRDAHKCYSDIISMRGLNMSVPMGSMYVVFILYVIIIFFCCFFNISIFILMVCDFRFIVSNK